MPCNLQTKLSLILNLKGKTKRLQVPESSKQLHSLVFRRQPLEVEDSPSISPIAPFSATLFERQVLSVPVPSSNSHHLLGLGLLLDIQLRLLSDIQLRLLSDIQLRLLSDIQLLWLLSDMQLLWLLVWHHMRRLIIAMQSLREERFF